MSGLVIALAGAPDKDFAAAVFLGVVAIAIILWDRVGVWRDDRRDVREQAQDGFAYSERTTIHPRTHCGCDPCGFCHVRRDEHADQSQSPFGSFIAVDDHDFVEPPVDYRHQDLYPCNLRNRIPAQWGGEDR